MRRAGLIMVLLLAGFGTGQTTAAAPTGTTAHRAVSSAKGPHSPPPRPRRTKAAPAKPAASEPKPAGSGRTLDEIHIEGEIPMPQVLFVTAREQRRFMESHHRRYLRTSKEVGQETELPSWIQVIGARPAGHNQETTR